MDPTRSPSWLLAAASLSRREIVRFLRQRSRLVGALASPLVFWVLLGSGIGRSIVIGGEGVRMEADFLTWFFPGSLVLIVLFTSIFSTISIIEDRREGFLQGVLVAPVGPEALVLGKIVGGSLLAVFQGLLFLALAPVVLGIRIAPVELVALTALLFLTASALTAVGFVLAWKLDSIQGFHAMMNLLLFPMWLLSGSMFPGSGAYGWVRLLMTINPLTYCTHGIRTLMGVPGGSTPGGGGGLCLDFLVASLFAALAMAAAFATARRAEQ